MTEAFCFRIRGMRVVRSALRRGFGVSYGAFLVAGGEIDLATGEMDDESLSEAHCCAYFLRDDAVSGAPQGRRLCPFWSELVVSLSLQVLEGDVINGCSGCSWVLLDLEVGLARCLETPSRAAGRCC